MSLAITTAHAGGCIGVRLRQDRPITYHDSDWYNAHRSDEHVHWLSDLTMRDITIRIDTGTGSRRSRRARRITGAGLGAGDRCVVTLPVGAGPAPRLARPWVAAGAVAGAASTPEH